MVKFISGIIFYRVIISDESTGGVGVGIPQLGLKPEPKLGGVLGVENKPKNDVKIQYIGVLNIFCKLNDMLVCAA